MIETDIREHRDLGPVERDRSVALVNLADEQFGVADQRACKWGGGGHEVLHDGAVHDGWLSMASMENPRDHSRHRRLATRAANTNAALRRVQQARKKLRARQVCKAELSGTQDVGHCWFDGRRRDQRHPGTKARAILGKQLDSEGAEIIELV